MSCKKLHNLKKYYRRLSVIKISGFSAKSVALIGVFAATDVALGVIPGWWISWAAIVKPLHGIILGPIAGTFAALIGGLIGNFIWPQTAVLAVFTWMPGIFGALAAGLMVKRQWKFVVVLYAASALAFYLHPVGNLVAMWALYDKMIALVLILPAAMLMDKVLREKLDLEKLTPAIGLISFIGTEADDVIGNVLFMFLGLYNLWGIPVEDLPPLYAAGAFIMPMQRVVIALIAMAVGTSLIRALERGKMISWPPTFLTRPPQTIKRERTHDP